ncbi:hypothetical protein B0H10DRAFT_2394506 [Mycena sp. CBHHK59/15]|nr:hypothetical protein B0H10DRAFT_2394506 [Mycena sp. CBHHK59/15]
MEDYRYNEPNLLDNRTAQFMINKQKEELIMLRAENVLLRQNYQELLKAVALGSNTVSSPVSTELDEANYPNVRLWQRKSWTTLLESAKGITLAENDEKPTNAKLSFVEDENGNYTSKDRASALRKIVYKVAFVEAEKATHWQAGVYPSWWTSYCSTVVKIEPVEDQTGVAQETIPSDDDTENVRALVSNTGTKRRLTDSVPPRKKPKTAAPSGRRDGSQKKDRKAKIRLGNPLVGTLPISKGTEATLPKPPPEPEAGERTPAPPLPLDTAPVVAQSPPVVSAVAPLVATDVTPLVKNHVTLTPLTVVSSSGTSVVSSAVPTLPDPKTSSEPISSPTAISPPLVPLSALPGDPLLVLAQAASDAQPATGLFSDLGLPVLPSAESSSNSAPTAVICNMSLSGSTQAAPAVSAPTASKTDPVPNLAPPQVVSTSGQKVRSLCGQLWKRDNPNGYSDEFNVFWKVLPKDEKQKWKAAELRAKAAMASVSSRRVTGVECGAVGASRAAGASAGQRERAWGSGSERGVACTTGIRLFYMAAPRRHGATAAITKWAARIHFRVGAENSGKLNPTRSSHTHAIEAEQAKTNQNDVASHKLVRRRRNCLPFELVTFRCSIHPRTSAVLSKKNMHKSYDPTALSHACLMPLATIISPSDPFPLSLISCRFPRLLLHIESPPPPGYTASIATSFPPFSGNAPRATFLGRPKSKFHKYVNKIVHKGFGTNRV